MAYGDPRLTNDIDLVLALTEPLLPRFIKAYPADSFYCAPLEVLRVECGRAQRGHTNVIHHETGFRADVYFFGEDELHQWAWTRRRRIPISDTLIVTLAPPEYVILRKLQFYQEGQSQKHLGDIRSMLNQLQAKQGTEQLDEVSLNQWISKFRLEEIWKLVESVP